jgi:hypothetical protein
MSKASKPTLDQSYLLYIRSKDGVQLTNGFNTNFNITFDYAIKRNNSNQDFHLSLSTAHIPFNFFQFSSNLENLIINVDGLSSFVLPEGNYDIYELIDLITLSAFPYSATYNTNNNKITLTNTDATTHTINFTSSRLYKNIGFTNEDIIVNSGGSITSTGSINLQTIHTLYIHSDLSLTNVLTSETKNISNIIDSINIDVNPFDIISHGYYESAPFSSILDQSEIKKINISLKDQNGRLIQLNSANFELSLLIELHDKEGDNNIPTNIQSRRSEMIDIQNLTIPSQQPQNIQIQPAPQPIQTNYIQPVQPIQPVQQPLPQPLPQPLLQPIPENNEVNYTNNTNNTNTNNELNDALMMASLLTF